MCRNLAVVALAVAASALAGGAPSTPAEVPRSAAGGKTVDALVLRRLKALGIEPADPCTDEVFLRRAFLDVIGTLPTAEEARQFILDPSAGKRAKLIDRLLERDEFATYWALKWSDLLRVKAEFPINLWPNAANAYYTWIRASIKANMPYDRFARELLTSSGSNFRVPQVNFYRAVQGKAPATLAQAAALTFMGARADKWPKERLAGMAAFFSLVGYKRTREWKEEIVFFDVAKAAGPDAPKTATFPDGTTVSLSPDRDPREVFADWLVNPKNPWFTRAIANRAWYWLMGRGIIHEPDDIRPDNPPSNPELLALLEDELRRANYDLKHLFRLILNSKTYQRSAVPKSKHPDAEANFASYIPRRLEAEVLIDALNQITGSTEQYSSAIPEPFTWIPTNRRTIALPDGSITSSFLEMFGRPPRDTGLESERNNKPTPAQRLHLLNSTHIRRKFTQSKRLQPLLSGARNLRAAATKLYLTILSRFPTEEELETIAAYSKTEEGKGTAALEDLAWALINSTEFLYRH